jgi:hypothetical protein
MICVNGIASLGGERWNPVAACPLPGVLRNGLVFRLLFILLRVKCGDYYKTGIGLTAGFIGSHTVTHSYSVYALTAHYSSL